MDLHGHLGRVTSLASPDGRTLASTSAGRYGADNAVKFWEIDREFAETRALTRRVVLDIIRPLLHRGSPSDRDGTPPTFDEGLAEIHDVNAPWYRGLDADYVARLRTEAEDCWRERWPDPWWLREALKLLDPADPADRERARVFIDAACELQPGLTTLFESALPPAPEAVAAE